MIFLRPLQEGNFILKLSIMILKFSRREILKEISLENVEVEHDFSEGLSKRVTLKFFWKPSNFIEFRIPYDFAIAS